MSSSDEEDFEDAVEEQTEQFTVVMSSRKKGHL